jgi:hypothetical protein
MPNPENVIGKGNRFKKGQSGNPNGRPKELPGFKELIKKIMTADSGNGEQEVESILKAMVKAAKRGDVRAAEVLFDRAYGKVVTTIAATDSEGKDKDTQVLELPNGAKITIG